MLSRDYLEGRRFYRAGQAVFSEGEESDFAYIVESGEVEIWSIVDGQRSTFITIGPGEMFGEMAILDGMPRSANATALTDCMLNVVTSEQFETRLRGADPIIKMLMYVVMKYFRAEMSRRNSLYRDSVAGSNGSKDDERLARAVDLIVMENELREGLAKDQFRLAYQPIFDLGTAKPVGMEALIRWNSPKRGFVPPDVFIALCELSELIVDIGDWILERAIRDFADMRKLQAGSGLFLSINIAAGQIEHESLMPRLADVLQSAGVPGKSVKLEITERTLAREASTRKWIDDCHALDCTIALDDFGTGYSSLEYLTSFPIDSLKIDRAFVKGIETSSRSLDVARGIVQFAKSLRLETIVEGVESDLQALLCRGIGCELAQGYYFAKPMSKEDLIRLLQS